MSKTYTLYNAQQGYKVLLDIWQLLKSMLMAGHRMQVTVRKEKRSLQQNAKLHALLTEISETEDWAGKKRDVETWKRLLVASWCRARGEHIELLPALDGNGVDIVFRKTSDMTKDELSELIEFVNSWVVTK